MGGIIIPGYDPGVSPCDPPSICGGGGLPGSTEDPPGIFKCEWPYVAKLVTYYEITNYPAVPGTPGQPYVQPGAAQVSLNLNEGWRNSCSSSEQPLLTSHAFRCSLSHDNRGFFIGLGIAGKELEPIKKYNHGLRITQDGVEVVERGVIKKDLASSYTYDDVFEISRGRDGSIKYSLTTSKGTNTYESTISASPTSELYIYGVAYQADDLVVSASIIPITTPVTIDVEFIQETQELLAGGDSVLFYQETSNLEYSTFATVFYQETFETIKPNAGSGGSAGFVNATIPCVNTFLTDLDDGDFDGIVSTLPSISVEADDEFVPTALQGIRALIPPVVSDGFLINVDVGQIDTNIAPIKASIFDDDNVGVISSAIPPVSLRAYSKPAGYMHLYNDIYVKDRINPLKDALIALYNTIGVIDDTSFFKDILISLVERFDIESELDVIADKEVIINEIFGVLDTFGFNIEGLPDHAGGPAWVMNIETGATSIFKDYDFNSFFTLEGIAYGVAGQGIYKLQETEALCPASAIDFGTHKFKSSRRKRIPHFYAAVASSGKVYLRLRVDGDSWDYIALSSTEYVENQKINAGKGLYGVFWNPILSAPEGTDIMEFESLNFEPVVLSRRK